MKSLLLTVLVVLLSAGSTFAQNWHEETRFVYEPGVPGDGVGESVAVHGQTALLGAPAVGVANLSPGYVLVLEQNGGTWEFEQKLEAAEGMLDDRFGFSLALTASAAVVGAPEADFQGENTGAAYYYTFQGNEWSQQLQLLPEDGEGGLEFGTSVAVMQDGAVDVVLVGAPVINITGLRTGEVYIFEIQNNAIVHSQRIQIGDFSFVAGTGESVALDNNLVAIGTPRRGPGGQNIGSVYLFERGDTSWEFKQELQASDATAQDVFGSSVDVDGAWMFVGAPREDDEAVNSGAVYIFQENAGTWGQIARLKAPTPIAEDMFGESVAVSGNVAVVGTSHNDDQGPGSGTFYVYEYDNSVWHFVDQFYASDAGIGDNLAKSVDISGDIIVAGAAGHNGDDSEESVGAAYFFSKDGSSTSVDELPAGSNSTFDAVLYPNPTPAQSTFSVRANQSQNVNIEMYDLLGRHIQSLYSGMLVKAQSYSFEIASETLPAGIYFVRIKGEKNIKTLRLTLLD